MSHKDQTSEECVYAIRKLLERDEHGHDFRNTVFENISSKTLSQTSYATDESGVDVKNIHNNIKIARRAKEIAYLNTNK